MLGAFQAESKAWMVDRMPDKFSYELLPPDWEKFAEPLKHGKHRIPALEKCGFAKFVNGPESFTPDNNFILGEAPELRHLFVAAGFNSVGIASAGGAGKYLAEWMIEGQPTLDLWSVDIRRFGPWANDREFLRERVTEVLGLHYQMAWPNREFTTGRGLRKSALHERLAAQGACFGVKNGWERPNWFARGDMKPVMEYSFGRQNWFGCHAAEHQACRERIAIFDQSGFSKYVVRGVDAVGVLQRLCGNDPDVPVGRIVYTGMFNERSGFESDLTIVRTGATEFYLISGSSQTVRDLDWIGRNIKPGEHVQIADVTEAWSVIGVMGPQSRALLGCLADADLSNAAFPFGTAQTLSVASCKTVRALRITYVGELGWELHVPADQAEGAYRALIELGREFGIANAGHYAINSLRLEKAYRAWGADLSPDDTALEAGLGFAIAWKKSVSFIGRDALLKQKQAGLKRQLVTFVLQDPEPMLWGSEPIYRNGQAVGYTTSGSYAHTLGAAIAMGYVNDPNGVNAEFIKAGHYEIAINGKPYDPERTRILA